LLSAVNACNDQFFPVSLKAQKVMVQSTTPPTDTLWLDTTGRTSSFVPPFLTKNQTDVFDHDLSPQIV
jgi:hypothetical protein